MDIATLHVTEPGGARELALPCAFGGSALDALRMPGAAGATAGVFEVEQGEFGLRAASGVEVRLNGRILAAGAFRARCAPRPQRQSSATLCSSMSVRSRVRPSAPIHCQTRERKRSVASSWIIS